MSDEVEKINSIKESIECLIDNDFDVCSKHIRVYKAGKDKYRILVFDTKRHDLLMDKEENYNNVSDAASKFIKLVKRTNNAAGTTESDN